MGKFENSLKGISQRIWLNKSQSLLPSFILYLKDEHYPGEETLPCGFIYILCAIRSSDLSAGLYKPGLYHLLNNTDLLIHPAANFCPYPPRYNLHLHPPRVL